MLNKSMIKIILVLSLLIVIISCASATDVKNTSNKEQATPLPKAKIMFTGQEISGDRQTGLMVSPWTNKVFISVGSMYHDFIFPLPYSESWQLESGTDLPLFATDDHYIASVNISFVRADSSQEFYQNFLENMIGSGQYDIQEDTVFKLPESNKYILRYQSKFSVVPEKVQHWNKWRWNYWVAIPHGSAWYALHLSVKDGNEVDLPTEEKKILFALESFEAGVFNVRQ